MSTMHEVQSVQQDILRRRIDEICSRSERTVVFVLGASQAMVQGMLEGPYTSLTVKRLLNDDGCVDLSRIQRYEADLSDELTNLESPTVFLYEQFHLAKKIIKYLNHNVVILQNNLFTDAEGYPSSADPSQLDKLALVEINPDYEAECQGFSDIYSRVSPVGGAWDYVASPIRIDRDLDAIEERIFDVPEVNLSEGMPHYREVAFQGIPSLEARLDAMNGLAEPLSFVLSNSIHGHRKSGGDLRPSEELRAFVGYLQACGIPSEVLGRDEEKGDSNGCFSSLLLLLKKYWGLGCEFRMLPIYRDPDASGDVELMSQGEISSYVVNQSLLALDGSSNFSNVMLTAPTGAGKSVLFQLPAMYLAENRGAVTLVVEPLLALMHDQVNGLKKRGVDYVVELGSDQTYDERQEALQSIKEGGASIIYLSPEMLLSINIESIIGVGRYIGLVVVDEVHTVTQWGRSFRPDYWYLGPFLKQLQGHNRFPVFCLTATAVYGGNDDTVHQIVEDLELDDVTLFLGSPRRENIAFDILRREKGKSNSKDGLALNRIKDYVHDCDHAIVYAPYTRIVDRLAERSAGALGPGVVRPFHGKMRPAEKNVAAKEFKSGKDCRVLVATKAFGMGLDIPDINSIYHFAPPETVADYVQEIGRSGRKEGSQAIAAIDFFGDSDLEFTEYLYRKSRLYQWQLQSIMRKLWHVFKESNGDNGVSSQRIHLSPNTFAYLFPDEDNEDRRVSRIKIALMMISRDLEDRLGYPVLVVRPRPVNTVLYVFASNALDSLIKEKYREYFKWLSAPTSHTENRPGESEVRVTQPGSVYRLNAIGLWRDNYCQRMSYESFLSEMFRGNILSRDHNRLISCARLTLQFNDEASGVTQSAGTCVSVLAGTFTKLASYKVFTDKQFTDELVERAQREGFGLSPESAGLIFKIFLCSGSGRTGEDGSDLHIIERRRSDYRLSPCYASVGFPDFLQRHISKVLPSRGRVFSGYFNSHALAKRRSVADLLQVFGLVEYQVQGGDSPELLVRLNDSDVFRNFAFGNYENRILEKSIKQHEASTELVKGFFSSTMKDERRWDLIEEYFLGNDDYVRSELGCPGSAGRVEAKLKDRRLVQGREQGNRARQAPPSIHKASCEGVPIAGAPEPLAIEILDRGNDTESEPLSRFWDRLLRQPLTAEERRSVVSIRAFVNPSVSNERPLEGAVLGSHDERTRIESVAVWEASRAVLLRNSQVEKCSELNRGGWKPFLLGDEEQVREFAESIVSGRRIDSSYEGRSHK